MEKHIKELVKNKSVIFVGNSVEIMAHKNKDFIDSHDIVVRFGRALEANKKQEESLGSKCDIWITGQFRSHAFKKKIKEFKPGGKFEKTSILVNRSRGNFKVKEFVIEKHICEELIKYGYKQMYTDKEIIDTMKVFDMDVLTSKKRPSTGFLAIAWFVEKIKTYKSLSIIGFDFFAKSTTTRRVGHSAKTGKKEISAHDPHSWHLPIYARPHSAHSHHLEEQFVSWLVRTNQLTWHVLSDLKQNKIKYTGWANNMPMVICSPERTKYYKKRIKVT